MYGTDEPDRWKNRGEIDVVGRVHHQIKLRGFRIELGHVEHALAGLPGLADALLLAREVARGDRRLVAYVVPVRDGVALRQQAARVLPDYMVPSAFVTLDRLPLTA